MQPTVIVLVTEPISNLPSAGESPGLTVLAHRAASMHAAAITTPGALNEPSKVSTSDCAASSVHAICSEHRRALRRSPLARVRPEELQRPLIELFGDLVNGCVRATAEYDYLRAVDPLG